MTDNKRITQLILQVESLSLQVAELQALIKSQAQQPALDQTHQRKGATDTFAIGDHVHILNTVKKPSHWQGHWDHKKAQVGTVLAVDSIKDRVHILTHNNTNTWRIHKNVKHQKHKGSQP
jgi:hypothetical protein